MLNDQDAILFATVDGDVTLSPAETMVEDGQKLAKELGCTVTARDPVSDLVLATFKPARKS
jgi:hypothetical protein